MNVLLDSQFETEQEYWRSILKRILSVIRFLASRGLAFRGEDETLGSEKNGNFLGSLELLSEYDPLLARHLKEYGNAGKGSTSYLSANICEEFIELIAARVSSIIWDELTTAKYYSISVDSTPDITHIDQLTFTVRYVLGCEPVKRFLSFIPIYSHGANNLTDTILEFLSANNIPLSNCRGQSYDNASNMAGRYSGVQARISEENEFALFIPCAGHSLNLVGVKAAECCQEAIRFFDFVQRLYSYFAGSTHRWKVLTKSLGGNLVVKRLSETRWSARYEAVRALYEGYTDIMSALDEIANDVEQDGVARSEAVGLIGKMERLETVILANLWNDVLRRVNSVSKELQSTKIDVLHASSLLESLDGYMSEVRNLFDMYERRAISKQPDAQYSDHQKRARKRSVRLSRFDGGCEEVVLKKGEKFRIESFLPILDSLKINIEKRAEAYKKVGNLFLFFSHLSDVDTAELETKCRNLAETFHNDI